VIPTSVQGQYAEDKYLLGFCRVRLRNYQRNHSSCQIRISQFGETGSISVASDSNKLPLSLPYVLQQRYGTDNASAERLFRKHSPLDALLELRKSL